MTDFSDRRQRAPMFRLVDAAIGVVVVIAASYLAWRGPIDDPHDLLPRYLAQRALAAGAALLALLLLWRARGILVRLVACGIALVLACAALARRGELRSYADGTGVSEWPPVPEASRAGRLETLSPAERAKWTLRLAAHRLGYADEVPDTLSVPADWPVPPGVEVALRRADGVTQVWARAEDGTAACLRIPARLGAASDTAAGRAACERMSRAPDGLAFAPLIQASAPAVPADSGPTGPAWRQYRGDAGRHGVAGGVADDVAGWRTSLDAEIRATPGVSGDLVLIGTHGIGQVAAIDRRTGRIAWNARVPNWVHQDPVTDGRVVVFGFGSDWGSFAGREPSGLAAFDRTTGRPLWTVFDESSVMTDPVILDSTLVYVSAAGVLRKRVIRTGALLGELRLPGGAIMAPPALVGDTLVATLDEHGVCAVLATSLQTLWCRQFPGYRLMGHAAPGVVDGTVVVSGAALLRALSLGELARRGPSGALALLRHPFGPGYRYAGQGVMGLSLHDGSLRWATRAFTTTREFKGHIAGTAVEHDGLAIISLPLADTLVVLDPASGAVRWTAEAHDSRGPPLTLDDQVLVAGRDGIIELRDLATGALRCTVTRAIGYDRGGPVVAGGLAIFGDLDGLVEAIPVADLLACRGDGARRPAD